MAISRKTASEFQADLETAILSRNTSYDTRVGPIPDLVIVPNANVFEAQNERIRTVQQMLSLENDGSFTDTDLDQMMFNESMVRLTGAPASTTLTFSRATLPAADVIIRANFPVATLADETDNTSVTFITTADATLVAANAASYFNTITKRYELLVPVISIVNGTIGNVGAERINRPLRALNGFDSVFNVNAATGGRDSETNIDEIARYFISLRGTSPANVFGIEKILRDQYPSAEDVNLVYGSNPLNVRSATDGGAVDVYIIGNQSNTVTENIVFTGVAQVIPLASQPIYSIVSAGAYVQGVDFELVKDTTSGYAGSVEAGDGIRFIAGGAAPAIGDALAVQYVQNALMQTLQDAFTLPDNNVPSRDILFKLASQIDITISANLKVRAGFSTSAVNTAVTDAIEAYINALELSDDVELSDLQATVRQFTGVDNFVITNIAEVGSLGTTDIVIADNEYARIDVGDLIITIV